MALAQIYKYTLFLIENVPCCTLSFVQFFKWHLIKCIEAKFKEFEPRLKFNYGCYHLKLYSIFQDLRRLLIETGFWQIKAAAQFH